MESRLALGRLALLDEGRDRIQLDWHLVLAVVGRDCAEEAEGDEYRRLRPQHTPVWQHSRIHLDCARHNISYAHLDHAIHCSRRRRCKKRLVPRFVAVALDLHASVHEVCVHVERLGHRSQCIAQSMHVAATGDVNPVVQQQRPAEADEAIHKGGRQVRGGSQHRHRSSGSSRRRGP
eukprot:6692891-Pyramimonas_sp.AAC.1